MRGSPLSPLHVLAICAPDAIDALSDTEILLLAHDHELSLRPEQRIPKGTWRSCGFICGRGWGKSYGIAVEINRRVANGEARSPVLVAPTIDRVCEVQVPALLETAPLDCPCETYGNGVRWGNGIVAIAASSEVERPSSGSNFDIAWLTEIVRWGETTRRSAFDDVTTATRTGPRPQYLWDTTSSGKNDVIQHLISQHDADPEAHKLIRGAMFDNPLLSRQYVIDEARKYGKGTRRYDEEILGLAFAEAAGALWEQEWIDTYRVQSRPEKAAIVILGVDPALSGDRTADEVGIVRGARDARGHVYLEDLSGKMPPEDYAAIVIRECQRDASGVVVERNHVGQHARDLINAHARLAGMRVEILPDAKKSFPPRRPGTIFVREIVSHRSKETRAAPAAAQYRAGRVHHIGTLARLEHEQTTWEPGTRRSPNRLDAAVFAVAELSDVTISLPRDVRSDVHKARQASRRLRQATGRGRMGL